MVGIWRRGIKMTVMAVACLAAAGSMGAGFNWPGQVVPDGKLIDPGAPAEGPANAKAVIVEFSDFQCPYCAGMFAYVNGIRRQAPEGVRVVWMDRPLNGEARDGFPFHPYSMVAHEAGCEAAAQGKFAALQAYVFTHQAELFPHGRPADLTDLEARRKEVAIKIVAACADLGLDRNKMEAALADHRWEATVNKRLAMAQELKINATPTVYVNGHEIGPDAGQVKKAVEKALGKELAGGGQ